MRTKLKSEREREETHAQTDIKRERERNHERKEADREEKILELAERRENSPNSLTR